MGMLRSSRFLQIPERHLESAGDLGPEFPENIETHILRHRKPHSPRGWCEPGCVSRMITVIKPSRTCRRQPFREIEHSTTVVAACNESMRNRMAQPFELPLTLMSSQLQRVPSVSQLCHKFLSSQVPYIACFKIRLRNTFYCSFDLLLGVYKAGVKLYRRGFFSIPFAGNLRCCGTMHESSNPQADSRATAASCR